MNTGIAEILGLFLIVIGCGTIVAAASLVSTALAVLAAGCFLLLGGVLVAYVATVLERNAKAAAPPRAGERT